MSIIAGIHFLSSRAPKLREFSKELRELLVRAPGLAIEEFLNDRTAIFSADVGAFHGSGIVRDAADGISILAGETLATATQGPPDRTADLRKIHEEIAAGRTDHLKTTRGTFCIVSLQKDALTLVADKLGVRQLFYCICDDFVVFSTALRILRGLSFVTRRLSVRGTVENVALGYPLGDRTPYENIFAMRGGEILQFRPDRTLRCRYWKWDEIGTSELSETELAERLYRSFSDAVDLRLGSDRGTIAYLSGGLDSRCVVASLKRRAQVHTFNFARPGTQDLVFGGMFAAKIGTVHNEVPKEQGDHVPDYSALIANAWERSSSRDSVAVERENIVWSGEGGSVALGHVQVARSVVSAMRRGRIDDAIDAYFDVEEVFITSRIFRQNSVREPMDLIRQGIREEFAQFAACEPARNFYLYLLLNEQRRKLHVHFENIDLHRREFQLPFFDAEVIRVIMSTPVDLCIGHRFYLKWLECFQPEVRAVPWQSYPGHEPCPVPVEDELLYQWDAGYRQSEQDSLTRKVREDARRLFRSPDFPRGVLSKTKLRLAYLIHRSGFRDYSYLIDTARVFEEYNRSCR